MTIPDLVPLVDKGLGNTSYLVDLGDGRALAVDPSRDLRAMREALSARGLRVAFAADTHLHADFLSGARQLAVDATPRRCWPPPPGDREFDHTGLRDGDEIDLGGPPAARPGHARAHR